LDECLAIADYEPAAESPVDNIDYVFDALALIPTTGIGDESGLPRERCQHFHIIACRQFVIKYVGEIEVYPRKMSRIKWVLVDGIHYELDFHIH
jgi:hypothetical protein